MTYYWEEYDAYDVMESQRHREAALVEELEHQLSVEELVVLTEEAT